MNTQKVFNKLFIFEIANNHMGDLQHGLRIIKEVGKVAKEFNFKFAFKLQYRDLSTFIHPYFKDRQDIKYVKRFQETSLNENEFKRLKEEIKNLGFISICTPFDENSVDLIEKHAFDIIKIGSCSFTDWPLLERIAKSDKPVILSTGGVTAKEMDEVVTFFEHRKKDFCLMHCVSEYPTMKENLQLNQIDFMRQRYPNIPIGYSSHEEPNNVNAIKIAVGKGALVFERHVGVATQIYKLNMYSSSPEQIKKWLQAAKESFKICGTSTDKRRGFSAKEKEDLRGLKRGAFANRAIKKGEKIDFSNIFLAIPNIENQLLANDLSKYSEFVAIKELKKNASVMRASVETKYLRGKVLQIINSVGKVLIESKISIPDKLEFELSHHYGIENFKKWGAAIINCINREYCKKIIIMLPGQKHPVHFHKKKEETFHILYGDFNLKLDGVEKEYKAGDMIIIERGKKHNFSTKNGVVFEEVSTTHYPEDSYYDDKKIIKNKDRKTEMTFWSDWLIKPIT